MRERITRDRARPKATRDDASLIACECDLNQRRFACESKNSDAIIGCLHAYRSFDGRFLLSLDK